MVNQIPDGEVLIIDYLINLINSARGGFFALHAAAGRCVFQRARFLVEL